MPPFPFLSPRSAVVLFAKFSLCSIALMVTGCGGGGESKPKDPQGSVSGSVSNDGASVTSQPDIVFFCKAKNAMAAGKVDPSGKFALKPSEESRGIPAGQYQVMIRVTDPPAPAVGTKEYEEFMSRRSKETAEPKDVPIVFGAFDTSGISVDVKVGENTFNFELDKLLTKASTKSAPVVK